MADIRLSGVCGTVRSSVSEEALALSVVQTDSVAAAIKRTPVVKLVAEVDRVRTGQVVAVLDCSSRNDLLARLVASHPLIIVLHEQHIILVAVWNQAFGDSKLLTIVGPFKKQAP